MKNYKIFYKKASTLQYCGEMKAASDDSLSIMIKAIFWKERAAVVDVKIEGDKAVVSY